jgi:hypothetical protein
MARVVRGEWRKVDGTMWHRKKKIIGDCPSSCHVDHGMDDEIDLTRREGRVDEGSHIG